MLTATLGPRGQDLPNRPPAAAPSAPSLLERFQPAVRLVPPPTRLRAAGAFGGDAAHEGFLPSHSFIRGLGPEVVVVLPMIEIRARALRRTLLSLAEEGAVVSAHQDSPVSERDALPFVLAVRGLIEGERITAARQMLAAAPAYILSDPLVCRLRLALAPPVVKRVQKRDVDRTQEYDWLGANGRNYRGRWVALVGSNLLASASTLHELQEELRSMQPHGRPLLHRVD